MGQGRFPSSRDLLGLVGRVDQRLREGAFVIWRYEPACWSSWVEVDHEREPAAIGGDYREADRHGLEGRLRVRVVDRGHHQCVAGGERVGKVGVPPPAGEEHPIRTDLPGNRDRVFALPLAGMPSPHHKRCRTMKSRAGAGEGPHQQRDPLGGGEAPDEDQHDGVAVGAQEAVTANHCVFVLVPLGLPFIPLGLLTGTKGYADSLRWRPSRGTTVLAIHRETLARQTWKLPPFMMFHVINAQERDDELVVDVAAYDDASILADLRLKNLRDPSATITPGRPIRLHLGPDERARLSTIADINFDFPRTLTDTFSTATSVLGLTSSGRGVPILDQVAVLDTDTGALKTAPAAEGTIAGEPVPLTAGHGKSTRWAAAVEIDATTASSHLVVYDVTDTPARIGSATLPHVAPLGLHGNWTADMP